MNVKPVKVALIGSGHISYTYLDNMVHVMKTCPVQPAPLADGFLGADAEAALDY